MPPELEGELTVLRARRGFDAQAYVRAKTTLLNAYLERSGISACVVGVSGGIDSAVTLGLVTRAAQISGSPIRRTVAALMPMFTEGATHQDAALARGREVARAFGATTAEVDLSRGLEAVRASVERGARIAGGAWSAGQLVSYLRTPALYHLAALLAEEGAPAVVLGTTNRDEGSYIGFFGKASDGMVDIQLISDIHKSEVRAVARLLGVPESVQSAVPSGDTFDGRSDEEMIGAPYDFLELFELDRAAGGGLEQRKRSFGEAVRAQLDAWTEAVERLHEKNAHKYAGGSVAIHFDVYERAVPGGWGALDADRRAPDAPRRPGPFIGEFELSRQIVAGLEGSSEPVRSPILDFGESAFLVDDLLSASECERLEREIARTPKVPVGRNGMGAGFEPERDPVGSLRASTFDPELAALLWSRLSPFLPRIRTMEDDTPTDWNGHRVWRAVGLNPLIRFMAYEPGGMLIPHYDSGYEFADGRRHTLMSVLVFLTDADPESGGATRLLLERQRHLPLGRRIYEDGREAARERDVLARVVPRRGRALVLDHRIPHDAEMWRGPGVRVVLRSDVVFERVGERSEDRTIVRTLCEAESEVERKIERDPYYGPAHAQLGSRQAVEEAGFFDDGAPAEVSADGRRDPEWLITPLHKITARLPDLDERWPAVLVTTGAFCPVHRGHLEMMELAKSALEAKGAFVLGGYLSPSHDAYVLSKCGPNVPKAMHRIRLAEEAVASSDWLMVDGWEALATDRPLNFTDVIERLGAYLSAHLRTHRAIRVVYVFGSDNARFSLTFVNRGDAVCIPRPGYEARAAKYAKHPLVERRARIVFANERLAPKADSTEIREGDDSALAEGARDLWRLWRSRPSAREISEAQILGRLFLRDEGRWAVEPWAAGRDLEKLSRARRRFQEGLLESIGSAFIAVEPPDTPRKVQIEILDLEHQRERVRTLIGKARFISLDPCIEGDVNLAVSRCFDLAVSAPNPGIVARPGWPPLEAQLARIPKGEYVLLDDDIATGHTIAAVTAALSGPCTIARTETLCALGLQAKSSPTGAASLVDLVDCRDFLAGAREAGLVVRLPNGALARAPYALPYVRLGARISVPISNELELSSRIWALNLDLFRSIDPPVTVAEASPAFRTLALYLGFDPSTRMEDVAVWHVSRLRGGGPRAHREGRSGRVVA
jgi:NAD+ synthetase